MPEENPETRKPDQQEVDLDIPTYLRRQREEGVVKPQRRKVRSRLSAKEIRAAVDSAPVSEPKAEEVKHPLDQYNFDEAGNRCTMAMVIQVRDDGEIGFVAPIAPSGKEQLYEFYNERFDHSRQDQYFAFYLDGEWHFVHQSGQRLPIGKKGLHELFRTWIQRKKEMH